MEVAIAYYLELITPKHLQSQFKFRILSIMNQKIRHSKTIVKTLSESYQIAQLIIARKGM